MVCAFNASLCEPSWHASALVFLAFLCCSKVRFRCFERHSCEVLDSRAKDCQCRLVDGAFDPDEKLEIEVVLSFISINR